LQMPIVKTSKDEIVLTALNVFRENGYYNTSMSDLATACGLHKGSFYHYFDSKETLMLAVLEKVRSSLQKHVFIIAEDETLSAKEKMETILIKLGKWLLERNGGCIVGNTILETSGQNLVFKETLKGVFSDWTAAMRTIYKEQYTEGTAGRLAEQTVMEFEGAVMFSTLYGNPQYLRDVYVRTMAKLK
jgi:TetR/AcrR family transcriptional regulator, transcriptional repressor for nem operon